MEKQFKVKVEEDKNGLFFKIPKEIEKKNKLYKEKIGRIRLIKDNEFELTF